MSAVVNVVIGYPFDHNDEDAPWLAGAVSRHQGTLLDGLLYSSPVKQVATFDNAENAALFMNELNASGRWKAAHAPGA